MAKGTIVVSLRSKGLPCYSKSIFDLRYQAVQFATEFWDIFLGFIISLACLSWSAWISVAVISVSIGATAKDTKYSAPQGSMIFVFFIYVVLPLVVLWIFVFQRRDSALRNLSEFKAAFVSLLLHRPVGTQLQQEVSNQLYQRAVTFVDDLRQYLQHKRPYARHFFLPYRSTNPSPTDPLLKVSRELGLLLRRVHRGVRDLHLTCNRLREAGVTESEVTAMVSRVEKMHSAVERLMCIKEMRTPVVIRATVRWFVMVMIPIAMGPFWNQLHVVHDSKAFSGILGVMLQVAVACIMDTVVAMEDPFDDTAVDAISLFEMIDQVGVMTTLPDDADGYDADGPMVGAPAADSRIPRPRSDEPAAHVAMYVSGMEDAGAALAAAGVTGSAPQELDAAAGAAPAAGAPGTSQGGGTTAQGQQTSASGSSVEPVAGAAVGAPSEQAAAGQQTQGGGGIMLHQPAGVPAMRTSITTSETAVGPPSAIEPHGGGAAGGAGTALPSITSPAFADMVGKIRAGGAMPPMPPLAGQQLGVGRAGSPVY